MTDDISDMATADYWIFNIVGIEWTYVIQTLVKRYGLDQLPAKKRAVYTGVSEGADIVYLVKREYLTVDQVSRAIGQTPEWLSKQETIKLRVKPTPDLPLPTVSGWGIA